MEDIICTSKAVQTDFKFSSVQFNLFNSIKSITSPRDLLDIELTYHLARIELVIVQVSHSTGWSKSLCTPDDFIVIVRCTETFWSSCTIYILYIHTHTHTHTQILKHKSSIYKVTIIIWAGNKMTLICGYWLIDLIYTIGRCISTIAFDKTLSLKYTHSFYIV